MTDALIKSKSESGDLLTDDEKLSHTPRWQGETRDLPTAIRELAKVHHLSDDIDESEDWQEFIDELVVIIGQLSEGGRDESNKNF